MSKIKNLIQYIQDYRIHIIPSQQFQGIKDTLLGWAIIGFSIIFAIPITNPIILQFSFIIVFFTGALAILLNVLFDSLLRGNGLSGFKDLLISSNTDKSLTHAHLTIRQRIITIYIRGFLATSNFIALNVAKIYFNEIDNSAIFGADALVFVALSAWILGKKISLKSWIGILIACGGVFLILVFDLSNCNWIGGSISGAAGIYSAITFSLIFVITSIIVRHDTPKRIVFHQCIMGTLLSICTFIVTVYFVQLPAEMSFLEFITPEIIKNSIILGVLYAWALYLFLRAFLYADPTIIAVMGYSLFIFVVFFDFFFENGASITFRNILSSLLITVGCALLLYEESKHEKKSSKKTHVSKPTYIRKDPTNKPDGS